MHHLNSETVADTIADIESGYLTQEEGMKSLRKGYDAAMCAFKSKYGFRPYKAGELLKCAWQPTDND